MDALAQSGKRWKSAGLMPGVGVGYGAEGWANQYGIQYLLHFPKRSSANALVLGTEVELAADHNAAPVIGLKKLSSFFLLGIEYSHRFYGHRGSAHRVQVEVGAGHGLYTSIFASRTENAGSFFGVKFSIYLDRSPFRKRRSD